MITTPYNIRGGLTVWIQQSYNSFLWTEIEAGDKGIIFEAFVVGRICTVCTKSKTELNHDF
jgi:hypothetical protein